MHPILFQWNGFTVYSYGFFVALAVILCFIVAKKRANHSIFDAAVIQDMIFFTFLFGVIGARAFYVLQHMDDYRGSLWRVFSFPEGGLVWYGGLFFAAAAGLMLAWFKQLPVLKLCDFFAPLIPLGEAVGRVGCFFNGCCYGKITTSDWGIQFPGENFSRYPIQLYWAASLILFSALLFFLVRQKHRDGNVFLYYLAGYSLLRFFIEFFRGDQLGVIILSLPQWTSLLLLIGTLFLLVIRKKYEKI